MEITRRVLLVISSPRVLKDTCTCAHAQKIFYLTLSQANVTFIQERVQKMLLPLAQSDRRCSDDVLIIRVARNCFCYAPGPGITMHPKS